MTHAQEIAGGDRFAFGKNWAGFLNKLTEARIAKAEQSLIAMLDGDSLEGETFLDVGSGSGLMSLAARRLGAHVYSFDFDPQSVACAKTLKERYFSTDENWQVQEGSVLDTDYLSALGTFDVVYSWGVLHHTGQMFTAIDNVCSLVKPGGRLFIAIYNNMGGASRRWLWVKRTYCRLPQLLRLPFALSIAIPVECYSFIVYLVQGKGAQFISERLNYENRRGMSWYHDQIDWIGGLPYEDAKPEEVFDFVKTRAFRLEKMTTCGGGMGCNEFVFTRCA